MSSAKIIKSLVKKNVGDKSTFGTNPSDPWSTKANIAESASLDQYLLSRGINPKFVSKDTKVAHAKSNMFLKWQADHARRLGEESEEVVSEATDRMDVIAMDIPFLIRMLEYAREDAKTDMALHKVVEKLINIRKRGVMTMKQYKYVTSIRECIDLTEECDCAWPPKNEKEWKAYAQKRAEAWRIKLLKVDEGKEADYGYDYQKSVQTVKSLAGKKPVDMKSLAARMQASYAKDEKKPVKEESLNEAGNKPLEPHIGMGDSRTPRELKTQMSGASTEFVKSTASKKPGMFHSKVAHMQSKLAKSELRKRTNEESLDEARKAATASVRAGLAKRGRKGPSEAEKTEKKSSQDADWDRLQQHIAKSKNVTTENTLDSMAATQAPNDCANSPDTTIPPGKKLIRMSKSAQIIKSAYKKGMKEEVVREEMYDHEKEDKSVSGLKKPKVTQTTEKAAFGETPKAAIVMSGGKTMTGEPRDTIEIDPAMKGKPGGPNDPTVKK